MDQPASFRLGLVATLLVAAALAGCGRKGPLELPPEATQSQTPAATAARDSVQPITDDPGLIQPPNRTVQRPVDEKLKQAVSSPSKPINGPEVQTGKPFILDPLL